MNRVILLFFAATLFLLQASAIAQSPNIVFIMLDDAGYGDFSCTGQRFFETPNIDRLAREGMIFTDHYSGSTVCAPTRCCLMMGVHTGHAYIRGNRETKPEGQSPIPKNAVTIPRLLKDAGYVTGMFGKWGLGSPGSHADPMEHFDRFYGYNCQRLAHNYYPKYLWDNDQKRALDGETYSSDLINQQALEFIRANKARRFFCYLPTTVPHASMHAPEESVAPFRPKFQQFEDKIGKYSGPEVKNPVAAFAGMMTRLDSQIGQLLDLLEELGIDNNTIVMLTSDNGPHKEGGHMPDFFDSNGPFRGHKRDLYEGGIRLPLLARWPGKIEAGSTSNHICAHWDMLATMCDLAQTKTPQPTDGISIVPTLIGDSAIQKKHDYLYWEFPSRGGGQAVRIGKWKGVRLNLKKTSGNSPIQLFDLDQDQGETNDIATAHPEITAKMQTIFKSAHEPSDLFKLY